MVSDALRRGNQDSRRVASPVAGASSSSRKRSTRRVETQYRLGESGYVVEVFTKDKPHATAPIIVSATPQQRKKYRALMTAA